ncbi:MAG: hypothetical protein A3K10_09410, partial [Bacteroidetes bacterium RIFCSPLOWO2_12_FULL_31_6]
LEQKVSHADATNPKISSKGVDWHIDHSLKVINGIILSLKKSNPSEYQWKFNVTRTYILIKGSIPRGKGKAPKSVVNDTTIILTDIENQLKEAKELILELDSLPKNSNFKHPYFGLLNLRMSKRFLKIHTNHHLKIIDDIIKEVSKNQKKN